MSKIEDLDIEKIMKESGFTKMEDLKPLTDKIQDLTIKNVLNHQECNNPECGICQFRGSIDQSGFNRGLLKGVTLAKKYPGVTFKNV